MQKRKILVLTYQRGGNEGAVAQAFALRFFLSKYGDCSVIDYFSLPLCKNDNPKVFIKKKHYNCSKRKMMKLLKQRKYKFDLFLKNYCNITRMIVRNSKKELKCDYCFIGSDQLLNPNLHNYDLNYFNPSFVSGKKIIYAGSTSQQNIESLINFKTLYDSLSGLDFISAREISTLKILSKITSQRISLVCDPVFLLDINEWRPLIDLSLKNRFSDAFVFVYYPNDILISLATTYAKKHNLRVYVIATGQKILPSPDYIIVYDDGPMDFIYLLTQSVFNFIGSFHAMALSIIFNKKFYCCPSHEMLINRMRNLFSFFSLPDCLRIDDCFDEQIVFDWETINEELKKYRDSGKLWIEEVFRFYETKR